MTTTRSIVFVIDDDSSVRSALKNLLGSVGLQPALYSSVQEFLESDRPNIPSCLVLDIRLPGASGLDFQSELAAANIHIPIIFITGHGDISMSVRAMKAGAVEFLTKPFRDQDLLDAIHLALGQDRARREEDDAAATLQELYKTLSSREREVMALVVTGQLNKQIAAAIGISEMSVKVHRGQVMRKMQAKSLANLVRMADKLNLPRKAS